MITAVPIILKLPFAFLRPIRENPIEKIADAKTINDIDEVLLRNVGKYDKNTFAFSTCEVEGFE